MDDYALRWTAVRLAIDRRYSTRLWAGQRGENLSASDSGLKRESTPQAVIDVLATVGVGFVWMWHGIVPKLIRPHPEELAILFEAGLPQSWPLSFVYLIVAAELIFGLLVLIFSTHRWPWLLTAVLIGFATVGVLPTSPVRALAASIPVTHNTLVATLAMISLFS